MKVAFGLAILSLAAISGADSIDAVIRQEMRRTGIPGVAVGILRNGRLEDVRTYGYVDLENRVKTHRDSVFEIGSISKQFTSAAVLLLAEDGKLKLEDTVGQHLPQLPAQWKGLTIRQILSHTAGLKDTVTGIDDPKFKRGDYYKNPGNFPLDFEPGTSWSYSNLGFEIAADIVESISGKRIDEFLRDRIWKPLGMTQTRFTDPKVVVKRRAKGYTATEKGYENAVPIGPLAAHGAGAIISTISDMAKWDNALFDGRVLKPASIKEYWGRTILKDGADTEYGLGWFLDEDRGRNIVEHGGNTFGFSAGNYTVPQLKRGYIVLTNLAGVSGTEIARRILVADDASFDLSKRPLTPDPAPRRILRLIAAFRAIGRNRMDFEPFAPNVVSTLKSIRGLSTKIGYGSLAKLITTFQHIETVPFGRGTRSLYVLSVKGAKIYAAVRWTPDGKVEKFTTLYTDPS